jgi:hypothetical protein
VACFYEGLICLSIPGNLSCSFVSSFWIIKVRCSISEQRDLVLKCWIEPSAEIDDNGFVILILCKVNQLLETVDVVINQIFGLILLSIQYYNNLTTRPHICVSRAK